MESSDWNARYQSCDMLWSDAPNRFVVEEFSEAPPGRALDLGAGEGRNARWLAGLGWRVTAVDFAEAAIERGRRLAGPDEQNIDWVLADLRTYQPPGAAFDAVIVAYLHLPALELARVLNRAVGALAPRGRILVVGHDLTNLAEGVGGPQDPALLYSPAEIVAELPGLAVRRADRVRRTVDTEQGIREAIDTLVCADRPMPAR